MVISDLCITASAIPLTVADSILRHIRIAEHINKHLLKVTGNEMVCSKQSGYRPVNYELMKGRDGDSQHTFVESYSNGSGAVDWTLKTYNKKDMEKMLSLLIDDSPYVRIAIYKNFVHVDFKETDLYKLGQKQIYKSDSNSNWKFLRYA